MKNFFKNSKIGLITLIIIAISLLAVLAYIAYPWLLMAGNAFLSPTPSEPKTKYGEFPFKLVYEINGETVTIDDTLVIEFYDTVWSAGSGKIINRWKVYHKNNKEYFDEFYEKEIWPEYESITLFDDYVEGIGGVLITFKLGNANYYMGLEESDEFLTKYNIKPGDIYIYTPDRLETISDEELLEKFNIKIIEKTISSPIAP